MAASAHKEEELSITQLTRLPVAELRDRLKKRGLDTTGRKAELVARLATGGEEEEDATSEKSEGSRKRPEGPPLAAAQPEPKHPRSCTSKTSKWQKLDTLLWFDNSVTAGSTAVYGFDMDDTLIKTKSGKVFPTGRSDWTWWDSSVPTKLKELANQGKKIVIFTNQSGINGSKGYDETKEKSITGKIEDIVQELGIPVQALVATTDDIYRKPATEMWDKFIKDLNQSVAPDLSQCAFIGDAAGRGANWNGKGCKKDFSCSDRKFAHNIGITFYTPEEFFLGEKPAPFDWESVNVSTIPETGEICDGGVASLTSSSQEMVMLVGFPASGKSTFAKTFLVPKGYVHINRDTLKTQAKCQNTAEQALASGKSVVVDNTNPDESTRAQYISIAKEKGVPVRCFRFDVDELLAQHLNYFRERIGMGDHVPRIGYAAFKKKFTEPELSEGFSEIKHIHFVANNFAKPEHKQVFFQLHQSLTIRW